MRRVFAVVISLLGGLLLLSWFEGLVPDGFALGLFLAVGGAVLFALSFIPSPVAATDAPPALTAAQRVTKIFFEPRRVFQSLRSHPRYASAFLIIVSCTVAYNLAFTQRLGLETIISASIDKSLAGRFVPPSQIAAVKQEQLKLANSPIYRMTQIVGKAVSLFIFLTLLAALYLLGVSITGGRIHFWQALAVAFYATLPPALIHNFLSLIILYLSSPVDINPLRGARGLVTDNLSILFVPAAHPILYTIASFIGFISFYGLWLTARGLYYASERSRAGAAWAVAVTVWLLTLGFNILIAALYPQTL